MEKNNTPAGSPSLENEIIERLKTVYDPEIPVNIYELGLIYKLEVSPSGVVKIEMTLTSPMCPVAGSLPPEVASKVRSVEGVTDVDVELVWEPPWSMERMSEAARLQLGMF
jgi:FeS assembly SUF system protein